MAMAAAKSRDEAPRPRAQDIDRHVGARMRERRIMLGLTQQQMADLIGVTYQQAHKYEKGINRIAAAASSLGSTQDRDPFLDSSNPQAFLRALYLQLSLAADPPQVRPDLILVLVEVLRGTNPHYLGPHHPA